MGPSDMSIVLKLFRRPCAGLRALRMPELSKLAVVGQFAEQQHVCHKRLPCPASQGKAGVRS